VAQTVANYSAILKEIWTYGAILQGLAPSPYMTEDWIVVKGKKKFEEGDACFTLFVPQIL